MSRRLILAVAAVAVAAPLQAVQAVVLVRAGLVSAADWQALLVANAVLMAGAAAVASDFVPAKRTARAMLVGIGVPMLLPGPTVVDSIVHALPDVGSWLALLVPNLLLLMLLGAAEAWVYLRATRPAPLA